MHLFYLMIYARNKELKQEILVASFSKKIRTNFSTSSSSGYFGAVKNPWTYKAHGSNAPKNLKDDWLIPGGSSGGSAVAVATGIVDVYAFHSF